jgi:hypothetical protein
MVATMLSLEREIAEYLFYVGVPYEDYTGSRHKLDFAVHINNTTFRLDAKEKRQRINIRAWPTVSIPERYLFILDDLSARKVLRLSPNSGIVIRDNVAGGYFFMDVVNLMLMPRVRVNRSLSRDDTVLKGKWMLDLRNGSPCGTLDDVFLCIERYLQSKFTIFGQTDCYGDYYGELIGLGGETRTGEHRRIDFGGTR